MSTALASHLTQLAADLDPDLEGMAETGLDGVRVFRVTRHLPRAPLVYDPGLVIIGQGHKLGHLDGREFTYGNGTYLILSVPIPFECETFATPDEPLLGLRIDLDVARVQGLLDRMGEPDPHDVPADAMHCGLEPAPLDEEMVDAACRLLRSVREPTDRRVLGPAMVDELVYRALRGPHGQALVALTVQQTRFARVARALSWVHEHYSESIAVEELAHRASMSTSSFFRAFKEVTGDTPLQYIKKIRLARALELLKRDGRAVSAVAYAVGYESPAQFSREFKRHFAASPSTVRDA